MELEVRRIKRRGTKLEDLPVELIQNIQSLLSLKDAARTSVLSKTWQRALSTIPNLRFDRSTGDNAVTYTCLQYKYIKGINRTLRRYRRENIPIVSFILHFHVQDLKSLKFVNKWIPAITCDKSCLRELHLVFSVRMSSVISLPNEIFSGENLHKISVNVNEDRKPPFFHRMSTNPAMIKCFNLRELELIGVNIISQELLDNLLSTCGLLEKIRLSFIMGVDTIKVKNLRYLRELIIESETRKGIDLDSDDDYYRWGVDRVPGLHRTLEIYDVPNLDRFSYKLPWKFPSLNVGLLGSMRELYIAPVFMDDRIVNLIRSKFPLLESLTLDVRKSWKIESLDITCASLKRLKIRLLLKYDCSRQIIIQVDAPKLLSFRYTGKEIPRLVFPTNIVPKQMKLSLKVANPVDCSFFRKLRENLNLSSNFVIKISSFESSYRPVPFNVDIDELRTMVPFPAANNVDRVKVKFETYVSDDSFWDYSSFFDAVLCICHPNYIKAEHIDAWPNIRMGLLKAMLEEKTTKEPHLKEVEVKAHGNPKWDTLTSSWLRKAFCSIFEFRLTWGSP